MINILVHGLGQNAQSWDLVNKHLQELNLTTICPDLFSLIKNDTKDYATLYQAFSSFCMKQNEKVNLCGISLGGVLSLDFVKEHPEKVNAIILIGTPYKIPKALFKLQGLLFHIMPKSSFTKMGCEKKEFIALVNSMSNLKINDGLNQITCEALILCGAKDKANKKGSALLNKHIKNSEFIIISDAGHEVNTGNPKKLSKLIYDFLKDKQ